MSSLYILGHTSTLSQAIYNFSLAFTSCLYRASSLSTSERIEPSQVFSEDMFSPGHKPEHKPDLLESKGYVGAFQSPYALKYLIP